MHWSTDAPWRHGWRQLASALALFAALFVIHIPAAATDTRWLFDLVVLIIVPLCFGLAGWTVLAHTVLNPGVGWGWRPLGRDLGVGWALSVGVLFARDDMAFTPLHLVEAVPWMGVTVLPFAIAWWVERRQVQRGEASLAGLSA